MKTNLTSIHAYKFSNTAVENKPVLLGETVSEFLNGKYIKGCIFGRENLMKTGTYKYRGWGYNFRPHLRLYVYRQHGEWQQVFAPSKKALRKAIYGRIDKILLAS